MGRSAWQAARHPDKSGSVILHGCDHAPGLPIPPGIGVDTVAIGVSTTQQRGMTSCGVSVGVIVVAIGEISSAVKQEPKSAFPKLISISLQIIAAKLVNDDDDDELRMRVVSRAKASPRDAQQQSDQEGARQESHRRVVYSVQLARPNRSNDW